MKVGLFLAIAAISQVSCANQQVAQPAADKVADQWVNVMRPDNQISAAINTATGEVKFYEDPKESFKTLFGAFTNYAKQQQAQAETKKPAKKKEGKK